MQLRDWLDLSLNQSIPSSLLILSRYALTYYASRVVFLSVCRVMDELG